MKRIFAVIALISLAACSTPAPQTETVTVATAQAPNQTCQMIKITGSSMPKKVCTTSE